MTGQFLRIVHLSRRQCIDQPGMKQMLRVAQSSWRKFDESGAEILCRDILGGCISGLGVDLSEQF